ncbi:glycine cleavage system protein GcvH [uncultured Prochlorococcus sp.]|uniref:glycine cleavage system protein GcvH n=1 Tax=uncultured Prochlorococcus sp. TaxID=159733 RepID=UPI002588D453|nr:glycine cleavage system protein GcvH [uncultured Prochlorococcus sp.]
MSYNFPDNLNYADTHEYVLEENGLLKIGVSEFAIDQLGDIVFVELVDEGATLEKGETFGTIESVKAVEEVYLPFSGEIVSINESVIENPELLQNDPIGDGWLVILKPKSEASIANLMTSEEYQSKVVPK